MLNRTQRAVAKRAVDRKPSPIGRREVGSYWAMRVWDRLRLYGFERAGSTGGFTERASLSRMRRDEKDPLSPGNRSGQPGDCFSDRSAGKSKNRFRSSPEMVRGRSRFFP